MTGDSGRAERLRRARAYLRDADPVLARLIEDRPDSDPRAWLAQLPPMDLFGALLFQVTGQQLSVAATRRAAYHLDHLPAQQEVLTIAGPWRPYRSLATSYLFSAAPEQASTPPPTPPQT
jgi:3-methyladenine DNA glycosylase/8-oxoguanine DNA glycosylase